MDVLAELVEYPKAAIYSGVYDVVSFTLHIRNNNEVRAVSYDKSYYWPFKDAIERAMEELPPFKLNRVEGGERSCYDIDITIDFSTLTNPIYRFMDVEIEDFVPARYDSKYGSSTLILELLTDEYREELYTQGVKSLLVTLYIERDGSIPSITITTLDGEKIDPSRYQPLKNRWTATLINGVPHRSVVCGRYNIKGKNIALKVLYSVSDHHNYC